MTLNLKRERPLQRKEWTVSLLAEQDGPGPMSYEGLLHGVCPTEAGFSFPATQILQERGSAPQPVCLLALSRECIPLIAAHDCLHSPAGVQTKPKCLVLAHFSGAQRGGFAALLEILGGSILKCKRKEVQKLASVVGLAQEEEGDGGLALPENTNTAQIKTGNNRATPSPPLCRRQSCSDSLAPVLTPGPCRC